ncbi:hypothetical protein [Clostridium sp.]|uniref:hypothetical protein n=1 Tax=Clostridium sp. TaxID=1506 RepID=UPI0039F56DBE
MGVKNKNTKLRVFFIQYLLSIFAGFLLIILIGIGLSFILLKTGFIISVGDVEESIERQKSAIMTAKTVTEELIPKTCKYAVISTSGDFYQEILLNLKLLKHVISLKMEEERQE